MISKAQKTNVVIDQSRADKRMKTENALKKPQHAWIRDIDNSYNVFVPSFEQKKHWKGPSGDLDAETQAMQKAKKERPEDFRCLLTFGEHKKQLDNNELSNPYENEVKQFDGLVKANDEKRVAALKVPTEAMAYKTLGETPFTFVDTAELLDEMATKLSAVTEIAIDLEHHN